MKQDISLDTFVRTQFYLTETFSSVDEDSGVSVPVVNPEREFLVFLCMRAIYIYTYIYTPIYIVVGICDV